MKKKMAMDPMRYNKNPKISTLEEVDFGES
jgi:hypothetical protein